MRDTVVIFRRWRESRTTIMLMMVAATLVAALSAPAARAATCANLASLKITRVRTFHATCRQANAVIRAMARVPYGSDDQVGLGVRPAGRLWRCSRDIHVSSSGVVIDSTCLRPAGQSVRWREPYFAE
jgi:hypothetical protein